MMRGDEMIGVLVIRRRGTGEFPPDVIELLETFASQSALAIVNARLFRELETKTTELEIASNHKSEFLASMSHELRTPLNAVIGFSEVLLERMFGEINERQDEYLRDIWNSGRHLLELLNEILDLSKVEAGQMVLEPSMFGVGSALDYTLAMVRERAASHAITITVDVADDVGMIEADELRFKQVRPQPAVQRRQVHAGRRQRVRPRLPRGHRPRGHGDRHRHRRAARGSGADLRILPAGWPRTGQGGGHRARPDAVATHRRAVRRPDVAGQHCRVSEARSASRFPALRAPDGGRPAQRHGEFPVVVLVDDDRASLDLMSAYLDGSPVQVIRATDGARRWS